MTQVAAQTPLEEAMRKEQKWLFKWNAQNLQEPATPSEWTIGPWRRPMRLRPEPTATQAPLVVLKRPISQRPFTGSSSSVGTYSRRTSLLSDSRPGSSGASCVTSTSRSRRPPHGAPLTSAALERLGASSSAVNLRLTEWDEAHARGFKRHAKSTDARMGLAGAAQKPARARGATYLPLPEAEREIMRKGVTFT